MSRKMVCYFIILAFTSILLANFSPARALVQGSKSITSYGEISETVPLLQNEVLVQWALSTDPNYAINISNYIGATAVLLITHVGELPQHIDQYRVAGLDVYLCVPESRRLLTPSDIEPFLAYDIKGIGIDLFNIEEFTIEEKENSLIELVDACANAGKSFSYYHGDGLSEVDAVAMAEAGCIVWAWFAAWKPGTWDLPVIWAQDCIWLNRSGHSDTTRDMILAWYDRLPREPEGIVWWLTTCQHEPTEEQIQGMAEVSQNYLGL